MKTIRMCVAAMLFLLVSSPSFAALSKDYAAFPKGPADLLMTKEERGKWKGITTNEQAKAFIDLFWARRDPTPGTPANEFRNDFDERVKVADARFHSGKGQGSLSDQGKVFILMGSPTKIHRSSAGPQSTIQSPTRTLPTNPLSATSGGVQGYSPKELWDYEQGKTPLQLGQPLVQIIFIDQYATNDWKLEHSPQTDTTAVFESVAVSFIAQPDLRSAPVFTGEPAPSVAVAKAAVPPMTEIKTEAYRAAIEQSRSSDKPSDTIFVTYGEFITPNGEHFVPVQLYLPKSAGIAADAEVTFFGTVEKDGGEKAAVFEEPAKLSPATDGSFYARSLNLLPGSYRASFGLANDGKPLGVVTLPMVVKGLDKDAPGVSTLILTDKIYPLPQAQNPTDPFAFGGLKVVPKSDGSFRKTEDLGYFFEVRNPGIDPSTSQPKVSTKMTISGTTSDGRAVKMAGPAEMAQMQELNGVPGHWAVGLAIPLAKFRTGSYTVGIKVTDVTLQQTYDLSGTFRVVE